VGAGVLESFPRHFNYPPKSHVRSLADLHKFGSYSFFCSNSCAAYLNSALDEIGGFEHVLLGEDTVAVAKLLHKGHHIAYVAEAVVRHSHGYSLREEFRRAYDTGRARRGYHHLLAAGGPDNVRGKAYALALTKHLCSERPLLLPYAALQTTVKWMGFKLGWNDHSSL
jgi:rhamnosyltransferase